MSLISDALKKARQEAARQDTQRQGRPYAVGTADPPRRRAALPLVAGLGAGCVVAGILFLIAWLAGWGPFARPDAPPALVAQAVLQPAAPEIPAAEPPPAAIPEMTPIVPRTETPAPPRDSVGQPMDFGLTVRPEPPAVRESPPAPVPSPPREEPPAVPAPATPATGANAGLLEDGKVYSGEVPVPGGGSLKLNGIAFSADHPVAVLNGRVMGPGEIIEGFNVVAIENGRVKLQGYGATVFLSPR